MQNAQCQRPSLRLNFLGRLKSPLLLTLGLLLAWCFTSAAYAQPEHDDTSTVNTAAVIVDGTPLFKVVGTTTFPASERAKSIAEHIKEAAKTPSITPDLIVFRDTGSHYQILAGSKQLLGVYPSDASAEGITNHEMAEIVSNRIADAIKSYRHQRSTNYLLKAALKSAAVFIGCVLFVKLTLFSFSRLHNLLESRYKTRVQDLKIESFEVVRAENIWSAVTNLSNFIRLIILLVACYLSLEYILYQFPWTLGIASILLNWFVNPLLTIGSSILAYLPDLVFLITLVIISRYCLKLMHMFFRSVEKKRVVLGGFEPEWAQPTYKLVRFLVVLLTVVLAYPYIPGSGSAAFQGLSILLGIMVSLGASSALSSIVAGYAMTYRRAFKIGDMIRVGEHTGVVEEMRLLVTHIRTFHNEEVVLPNSQILNSSVTNLSRPAQDDNGLLIHIQVGIGYDTPWRQVEAMLKEAANRTRSVKLNPAPFVLVKELGDYAIIYQLNSYIASPAHLPHRYAELNRNILDVFNEYEVQIMSPSYVSDPDQTKIVTQDEWYRAPAKPDMDKPETAEKTQKAKKAEKAKIVEKTAPTDKAKKDDKPHTQ